MNLFIRIDNGKIASHPVIEENLRSFYPDLDPNNPPEGFERFEKQPYPTLEIGEIVDKVTYEISNYYTDLYNTKTWTDVYHVRTVSPEEKQNMIDEFKYRNPYVKNWVFDEEKQALVPPVPKPDDGGEYVWIQDSGPVPKRDDGNEYMWVQDIGRWIDIRKEMKNLDLSLVEKIAKDIGMEMANTNKANLSESIIDFILNNSFEDISIYKKDENVDV